MQTTKSIAQLPFVVLVLPAQEDIATFQRGQKPLNILTAAFSTSEEVEAYRDGFEVLEGECDEIEGLVIVGSEVTYSLSVDDVVTTETLQCSTPAEANAFAKGVEDSEGFRSPMILTAGDEGFDRLKGYADQEAVEALKHAEVPGITPEAPYVPTIILYKDGDKITSVVASEEVRVVLLDVGPRAARDETLSSLVLEAGECFVTDLYVRSAPCAAAAGDVVVSAKKAEAIVSLVDRLASRTKAVTNELRGAAGAVKATSPSS